METTTTTIRGLTIDVLVRETMHRDLHGVLFYLAVVVVRERKTGIERVVRRSRLPGACAALVRDVQRMGVRLLDKLAT